MSASFRSLSYSLNNLFISFLMSFHVIMAFQPVNVRTQISCNLVSFLASFRAPIVDPRKAFVAIVPFSSFPFVVTVLLLFCSSNFFHMSYILTDPLSLSFHFLSLNLGCLPLSHRSGMTSFGTFSIFFLCSKLGVEVLPF